jgi:pyrroloquinoline quinone biosynthesis protein B
MRVKVLGSAAGGGFPQWNCACSNCSRLRGGVFPGHARTQTQLAVTADDASWFLLNASPDLRQQILATLELAPTDHHQRGSPIAGVVITAADVDFVMGLLHLREFQPLRIYSTRGVRRILTEANTMFRVLERAQPPVEWCDLPLGKEVPLAPGSSSSTGHTSRTGRTGAELRCTAIPLNGGYPDYVDPAQRETLSPAEAVVALTLTNGQRMAIFAPGLPGETARWKGHMQTSDLALLDGTFWSDGELAAIRSGSKTARQMGHLPLSGPGGLLEELRQQTRPRRVAIHINNTNPVLNEESEEHRVMIDAGWEIARDGMEFVL